MKKKNKIKFKKKLKKNKVKDTQIFLMVLYHLCR